VSAQFRFGVELLVGNPFGPDDEPEKPKPKPEEEEAGEGDEGEGDAAVAPDADADADADADYDFSYDGALRVRAPRRPSKKPAKPSAPTKKWSVADLMRAIATGAGLRATLADPTWAIFRARFVANIVDPTGLFSLVAPKPTPGAKGGVRVTRPCVARISYKVLVADVADVTPPVPPPSPAPDHHHEHHGRHRRRDPVAPPPTEIPVLAIVAVRTGGAIPRFLPQSLTVVVLNATTLAGTLSGTFEVRLPAANLALDLYVATPRAADAVAFAPTVVNAFVIDYVRDLCLIPQPCPPCPPPLPT
jgi:hypothetical protein